MGQDDLARLIEKLEREKKGLADNPERYPQQQVHPAIGSPKQHLESRSPASVVALSKENAPGLKDHAFDRQGIAIAVGAAAVDVIIAQYMVPKGQIAVLKGFGWSCLPIDFATLTFTLRRDQRVVPAIPSAASVAYIPSANTINPGDLANVYESCLGPGSFDIVATNAGAATTASARLIGYFYYIGSDEEELGDRKYDQY